MKKAALSASACFILFASSAFCQEDSRYFQNVTVETGDTLWSLARRYLKDPQRWPELLKHNQLPTSDPTVALPGMVLKIPVLEIKESLRAAKLLEWMNSVTYRKTDSALWLLVNEGLELFQDYGVRTAENSWTRIRFAVGEDLTLGANSFALIRPQGLGENIGRGARLLSGEVQSRGVRLVTQTAKIIPKTKETDFRARIRDDLATVVEVYKGETDVEAKGKKVAVKAGFATQIPVGQPPAVPVELPPIPKALVAPLRTAPSAGRLSADSAPIPEGRVVLRAGVISMNIPKTDTDSVLPGEGRGASSTRPRSVNLDDFSGLVSYRIQVAREKEFREIILDRSYAIGRSLSLHDAGLADGRYFFRVSYKDRLGFESPFNQGESLVIDTTAPILEMAYPDQPKVESRTNPIRIEGRTEPGAFVLIQARVMATDTSGHFYEDYVLKPGVNSLTLSATDASGNKTEKKFSIRYAATAQEIARAEAQERELTRRKEEAVESDVPERAARTAFGFIGGAAIAVIIILLVAG